MDKICAEIYEKVFSNIQHSNVDIFLCGGASDSKKQSYRDKIRDILNDDKSISILYPEDLFTEMLNKKKYDLLTLEKFLANNSDLIVIVCESPGSFTELGAFVNNEMTLKKVVVLLHVNFKNAKSFIRQGPVEYVKKSNSSNVIFYDSNVDETVKKIVRCIRYKFGWGYKNRKTDFKDLDLISGQYYFIVLLLYFFEKYNVKELIETIRAIYESKEYEKKEFDVIYDSAIKRLYKDRLIKKEFESNNVDSKYKLTKKGYYFAQNVLSYVRLDDKTQVFNKIRMNIMYKLYY